MGKTWTDEEKEIARRLYDEIRDEVEKAVSDATLENAVKKIAKLSKEGLSEDEIAKRIMADQNQGDEMPRGIQGRLAIARMERCM